MSQIRPNGSPDNVRLGFIPAHPHLQPVRFQPHEGAQRQLDVAALRRLQLRLALLDPAALLDAAMIHLNPKRLPRPLRPLGFTHGQVARRPVFRVAVCGDRPKHADEPVPLQVHDQPLRRDRQRLDWYVAGVIGVHQAVALEPGEPVPAVAPHRLQVLQPGIPTIEGDHGGGKASFLGGSQHAAKVRVLVVDSQAVSRAGLRHLLESYADLQVIGEASDGVQAVSETVELGPQVVLMDAQLPNNQSIEALKQIKQLNLDTRVLLLSAQEREEYLYETLRAGADGYVLKDIAPDELAQAVRVVAGGEVLVQPQLAGRLLSRFGKQGRSYTPYETLTAREQEVLQLLARGLRNKEIAARLIVSERTVNFHLANIYQKLNVSGRTEALSKALEQGLITA